MSAFANVLAADAAGTFAISLADTLFVLFFFFFELKLAFFLFLAALFEHTVHTGDIFHAETGGEYGNLYFTFQCVVHSHTPDYLYAFAELAHEFVDLVHFLHHQFRTFAEGYVQHHLLGIEDIVVVQQRRVQGIVDGFRHTTFTFAEAGTHDGNATVFEDGLYICKVQVHRSTHGDDFCNTFGGDGQRIICLAKSIHKRKVGIYFAQTLIVDNQ